MAGLTSEMLLSRQGDLTNPTSYALKRGKRPNVNLAGHTRNEIKSAMTLDLTFFAVGFAPRVAALEWLTAGCFTRVLFCFCVCP